MADLNAYQQETVSTGAEIKNDGKKVRVGIIGTGWIAGARFSILAIPLKIRYNVTKLVLRKGDKHYGIPLRYPAPDRWQGSGPSGPGPPGLR